MLYELLFEKKNLFLKIFLMYVSIWFFGVKFVQHHEKYNNNYYYLFILKTVNFSEPKQLTNLFLGKRMMPKLCQYVIIWWAEMVSNPQRPITCRLPQSPGGSLGPLRTQTVIGKKSCLFNRNSDQILNIDFTEKIQYSNLEYWFHGI